MAYKAEIATTNRDKTTTPNPAKSHFVSSLTLLCIRLFFSLYILLAIIINIAVNYKDTHGFVMHLTNFNYYGLAAYIWISTYFSFIYNASPTRLPINPKGWCYRLHRQQFACCIVINTVVTTLFLALIAKDDFQPHQSHTYLYLTISYHLLNSFIIYTELILTKHEIQLISLPLVLLVMLIYLIYVVCFQAITGTPAYPFLDYMASVPHFLITCAIALITTLLAFGFIWSLTKLRSWYVNRSIPNPIL